MSANIQVRAYSIRHVTTSAHMNNYSLIAPGMAAIQVMARPIDCIICAEIEIVSRLTVAAVTTVPGQGYFANGFSPRA
jgi:hypothetical protein